MIEVQHPGNWVDLFPRRRNQSNLEHSAMTFVRPYGTLWTFILSNLQQKRSLQDSALIGTMCDFGIDRGELKGNCLVN